MPGSKDAGVKSCLLPPSGPHQAPALETRGKVSGLRIDSTERSTSSCGQYTRSGVGHCTSSICWIVAFLNHGNLSKGSRSSSLPSSSQRPCFETCVTSGAEVMAPGESPRYEPRRLHALRKAAAAIPPDDRCAEPEPLPRLRRGRRSIWPDCAIQTNWSPACWLPISLTANWVGQTAGHAPRRFRLGNCPSRARSGLPPRAGSAFRRVACPGPPGHPASQFRDPGLTPAATPRCRCRCGSRPTWTAPSG